MVKQIHNCEVVEELIKKGNGYFHWLQKISGISGPLSSMFADTEFVSKDKLDDVLVEKAKEEVRRRYTDDISEQEGIENDKDVEAINKSIRGDCCVFEVIVCLAISLNEMFEDFDAYDGTSHFCNIMMENAGFNRYDEEDWDMRPEEVKAYWEKHLNRILDREYGFYGGGGFFPLEPGKGVEVSDRRHISLWQQMNDWVDQHTDEDGEWVD